MSQAPKQFSISTLHFQEVLPSKNEALGEKITILYKKTLLLQCSQFCGEDHSGNYSVVSIHFNHTLPLFKT